MQWDVTIDLMSSRTYCQVSKYISWRPDPGAVAIDAFTINWNSLQFWCFPPFSLIPRVIKKIREDQATGLLVVPNWPTQSWYPQVMQLLTDHPRVLPKRDTPPSRKIGTTGLSLITKQFENQGLSQQSTDIILNAWRPSTVKQYMPYIRKWETYCSQQQIDPIHTNISQVLNFLTQLFNTGVCYSAINTAKSALSALIVLSDSRSLGQHSLVTRYMKGVFRK